MSTTGESLREVERRRGECLRRADNLLPETARLLSKVADASLSAQVRELGTDFRTFVLSLKDAKGKPRNMIWARHLVAQWRQVSRWPGVAEACLSGHALSKACLWVRVAETEGWYVNAMRKLEGTEMNRNATRAAVGARIVRLLEERTWAEAEAKVQSLSPAREKIRMGGVVLKGTKEAWAECWAKCALLLDRPTPKHPAFEWQLETVMMVAQEVIDAAEQRSKIHTEASDETE